MKERSRQLDFVDEFYRRLSHAEKKTVREICKDFPSIYE